MQRYDARRMPDTLRVWTLGGFQISVGTRTIAENAWGLRKAAAKVKLLALSPGHRLHRERVIFSDTPGGTSRAKQTSKGFNVLVGMAVCRR